MNNIRKSFCICVVWILTVLPTAFAGNLDATHAPSDAGSSMFTLEDIYNRLATGAVGAKRSGPFAEPASDPGGTGHTLNDVMSIAPVKDDTNGASPSDVLNGKKFWGLTTGSEWGPQTGTAPPAAVPQTGQTKCYDSSGVEVDPCSGTGQDGELQKGAVIPVPRFTDNNNGTVTDNLTGLIWLKNANCFGKNTWADALTLCNSLANGYTCTAGVGGTLSDGSSAGDWRLPNIRELMSLLNFSSATSNLSPPAPISSVQTSDYYWTSTTSTADTKNSSVIQFGGVNFAATGLKSGSRFVWAVRGGQ